MELRRPKYLDGVRWSSFSSEGGAHVQGQLCNHNMVYPSACSLQHQCMANMEMPLLTATEQTVPVPFTPHTFSHTPPCLPLAPPSVQRSVKCQNHKKDSIYPRLTHHQSHSQTPHHCLWLLYNHYIGVFL